LGPVAGQTKMGIEPFVYNATQTSNGSSILIVIVGDSLSLKGGEEDEEVDVDGPRAHAIATTAVLMKSCEEIYYNSISWSK
jgi:hypothetical protein